MTEKQFEYIVKICPQTIECGKHILKPCVMSKKLKTLPQPITQNLIDYGKEWQNWCRADDVEFILNSRREYSYLYLDEYEVLETATIQMKKSLKEMNRLKKVIEKQLDKINWSKYECNLDDYKGELELL